MNKNIELLKNVAAAGVWRTGPDARALTAAAEAAGYAVWRLDIGRVHGKADLLRLIAEALAFPPGFGGNWDALRDCLADLSWRPAPGYLLVLERPRHFADAHREDCATAFEVFADVVEQWRARQTPFWVIVAGPDGWDGGLPALR
jgi:hypothetical protein